jgi:hypothetical protein
MRDRRVAQCRSTITREAKCIVRVLVKVGVEFDVLKMLQEGFRSQFANEPSANVKTGNTQKGFEIKSELFLDHSLESSQLRTTS